MPARKRNVNQKWSMYPALHDKVSNLLEEEDLSLSFHPTDNPKGCLQEYDTNIMGRFRCHTNTCTSNGWSSKKIAVTIRMYPGDKYNARVYHQRCMGCNSLSRPILDDSYAERVAYRLKKWKGVEMENRPHYSGQDNRKPHNSKLCEGCKAGHCKQLEFSSTWF